MQWHFRRFALMTFFSLLCMCGCGTKPHKNYVGEAKTLSTVAAKNWQLSIEKKERLSRRFTSNKLYGLVLARCLDKAVRQYKAEKPGPEETIVQVLNETSETLMGLRGDALLGYTSISTSDSADVRGSVAYDIGVKVREREWVDVLLMLLNDKNRTVRGMAIARLELTTENRERVLAHLAVRACWDKDELVRKRALRAMGRLLRSTVPQKEVSQDLQWVKRWIRQRYGESLPLDVFETK